MHKTRIIFPQVTYKHASGFTLIELMVALLIGLILIAGALKIFDGNRSAYQQAQHLSELQNNLRFVSDIFSSEIRGATAINYFADASRGNALTFAITRDRSQAWCGVGAGTHEVWYQVSAGNLRCLNDSTTVGDEILLLRGLEANSHFVLTGYGRDGKDDEIVFELNGGSITVYASDGNTSAHSVDHQDIQNRILALALELEFKTTASGEALHRTVSFLVTLRNRALSFYSE